MIEINKSILNKVFKKRKDWSYKYDYGSLLIIGGSKLYHGSPALAAMAALKTGVDLVTILAPERAANIIASFSPDLITYPLKGDYLDKKHLPELMKFSKNKTAVVIGGGLCREKKTLLAVREFLKRINIPTVIDADAIHAVARNKGLIKKNFILTPHAHEFYVLTGKKPSEKLKERTGLVKKAASDIGAIILLKGYVDIISDGKQTALNSAGSPMMTVGGTGDTLAGICGSLLAQNIDCFNAACAAAFINGRAGDLAAKNKKQSLLATDLIEKIPDVFR